MSPTGGRRKRARLWAYLYVKLFGEPDSDADGDAAARSDRRLDRGAIAESYWHLVEQPASAWTMELDLGTENRNPEF